MNVKHRYFLQRGQGPEREVGPDEYLKAQVLEANITTTQNAIAFDVVGIRGRIKTEIEE